jgi:riboflavin synthase
MFTGLIEEVGRVAHIKEIDGKRQLTIEAGQLTKELKKGDSIAVSGVCLTAVDLGRKWFAADLAAETWKLTSFSRLSEGALVNLELPLKPSSRLGGHIVQGHVDGTGRFLGLDPIPGAQDYSLRVEIPADLEKYLVYKGSITIEGISLTVARIEDRTVTMAIIPHTLEMTNLKSLQPGDPVNIETDILARYIEKMLHCEPDRTSLTVDTLLSQGF